MARRLLTESERSIVVDEQKLNPGIICPIFTKELSEIQMLSSSYFEVIDDTRYGYTPE